MKESDASGSKSILSARLRKMEYALSVGFHFGKKCSCREIGNCLLCVCPYILWTSLMTHAAVQLNESDWGKCWGWTCNCVLKLVAICLGVCVDSPNDFLESIEKAAWRNLFTVFISLCCYLYNEETDERNI